MNTVLWSYGKWTLWFRMVHRVTLDWCSDHGPYPSWLDIARRKAWLRRWYYCGAKEGGTPLKPHKWDEICAFASEMYGVLSLRLDCSSRVCALAPKDRVGSSHFHSMLCTCLIECVFIAFQLSLAQAILASGAHGFVVCPIANCSAFFSKWGSRCFSMIYFFLMIHFSFMGRL